MQAASVIGELWVTYHVRFHKPKLPTPVGGQIQAGWLNYNRSGTVDFSLATADPDNTIQLFPSASSMSVSTPNVISGVWLVVLAMTGNVTATSTISAGTGASLVATTTPFTTGVVTSFQTGTATISVAILTNTSPIWTVSFAPVPTGTGTLAARIYVTQMNNAVAVTLPLARQIELLRTQFEDLQSRLTDADEDAFYHRESGESVAELERSIHISKEELRKLVGR